jgi:hypothetical protein
MEINNQKLNVKSQKRKKLLTFFLFTFSLNCFAQQKNFSLNREWDLTAESVGGIMTDSGKVIPFQSCFKPYNENSGKFPSYNERSFTFDDFYPGARRKIFFESLITIQDSLDKFHLAIDPLFNFEYGRDHADSSMSFYKNTRGVLVRGDIGKKISFESSFLENQATFVKYIGDYIKSADTLFPNPAKENLNVIPGQGRAKPFKKNGYDFAMSSGYVSKT